MVKKEDVIEELREWKHEQEKKEAVRKATQGYIMLRCTTVLVAIWTFMGAMGAWMAAHFNGLEAAVRAFIQAEFHK